MSDETLVDYYTNLLLIQYLTKPKAIGTVRAFVDTLMISDLITAVRDGYNVLTAVGTQLDVLGKYAGIGRQIIGFPSSGAFFGFLEYGETPPKAGISGFTEYGTSVPGVRFRSYRDANSLIYVIPDEQYRQLIQLKILKNHSNGSLESVHQILSELFGTQYRVGDSGEMVLRYIFQTSDALLISIAQFAGLLPRPTGVGFSIGVTPNVDAIWGFGKYGATTPSNIIGFKEYGDDEAAGGMMLYG